MNELNSLSLTEMLSQTGSVGYTNVLEMKGLKMEQSTSAI
jgi:hypothetical protein